MVTQDDLRVQAALRRLAFFRGHENGYVVHDERIQTIQGNFSRYILKTYSNGAGRNAELEIRLDETNARSTRRYSSISDILSHLPPNITSLLIEYEMATMLAECNALNSGAWIKNSQIYLDNQSTEDTGPICEDDALPTLDPECDDWKDITIYDDPL